jgi:hypothetical protein
MFLISRQKRISTGKYSLRQVNCGIQDRLPKSECGDNNTLEDVVNSCVEKMNEEERKIHTKEFKEIFK